MDIKLLIIGICCIISVSLELIVHAEDDEFGAEPTPQALPEDSAEAGVKYIHLEDLSEEESSVNEPTLEPPSPGIGFAGRALEDDGKDLNNRVLQNELLYAWSNEICSNTSSSSSISVITTVSPVEQSTRSFVTEAPVTLATIYTLNSFDKERRCGDSFVRPSGDFHTPNHPKYYPPLADCVWVITVPDGFKINLVFDYGFSLEEPVGAFNICSYDVVEVFDSYTNSSSLGKYCGHREGLEINSTSNVMMVAFTSDSLKQMTGFHATFTAIPSNNPNTEDVGSSPSWPIQDLVEYINETDTQQDCVEKFLSNLSPNIHGLLARICLSLIPKSEELQSSVWFKNCTRGILYGCSSVLNMRNSDRDLVTRLRQTIRNQCRMECHLESRKRCAVGLVQQTFQMILSTETPSLEDCKEILRGSPVTCLREQVSLCRGARWTDWYEKMANNLIDKTRNICEALQDNHRGTSISPNALNIRTCRTSDLSDVFNETAQGFVDVIFNGSRSDLYKFNKRTFINSMNHLDKFKGICSENLIVSSKDLIRNYTRELVPELPCNMTEANKCIDRLDEDQMKPDLDWTCKLLVETRSCVTESTVSCRNEGDLKKVHQRLKRAIGDLDGRCEPSVTCLTNEIELEEGGPPKPFQFHMISNRYSVVCRKRKHCKVYVDFYPEHEGQPSCGGRSMKQFGIYTLNTDQKNVASGCSMEITEENWKTNRTVMLAAKEDFMKDGNQTRKFHLVVRVVPLIGVKYILETRKTETACTREVKIRDRNDFQQCIVATDPEIYTFDTKHYVSLNIGKFFRLYRHKELPIEIHAEFQTCGNFIGSCACSVAVRVLDDVYYKSVCAWPKSTKSKREENTNEAIFRNQRKEPPTIKVEPPTIKVFSIDDNRVILLPHGGKVYIRVFHSSLNIHIDPSAHDLYKTEGLCGTYDNNDTNDLVWPDGTPLNEQRDASVLWGFVPHYPAFVNSWSIDPHKNFSRGAERSTQDLSRVFGKICDCERPSDDEGDPAGECLYTNTMETCNLNLGEDLTETYTKKLSNKKTKIRRSADVIDHIQLAKIDSGNWTFDLAMEHCKQHLGNSRTSELCSELSSYSDTLNLTACAVDIMLTGGTEFVDGMMDVLKQKCDMELSVNETFTQTDTGRQVASQFRNHLCTPSCSENGACENGECICEVGYAGSDCSQSSDFLPVGVVLEDEGLCDSALRSCSSVFISADLFVNTKLLNCSLQFVKIDDHSISNSSDAQVSVKAEYLDRQTIACPLPESVHLSNEIVTKPEAVTGYMISVTNNGVEVMKPKLFVGHDSRCHTCAHDEAGKTVCVLKEDVCFVNGELCYESGEKSVEGSCLICQPHKQRFKLSVSTDPPCTVPVKPSLDLALLLPLIMLSLIFAIIVAVIVVVIVSKKHFGTVAKKFNFNSPDSPTSSPLTLQISTLDLLHGDNIALTDLHSNAGEGHANNALIND